MGKYTLAFVAFDSAKEKHAVAIADDGRDGEVRYLGEIDNSPDAVPGREFVARPVDNGHKRLLSGAKLRIPVIAVNSAWQSKARRG